MLKSFLQITLRNILKNKGSSYLNIAGLTLSIAICLFIFHYIRFETTYDSKEEESNVYRVESQYFKNQELAYQDALTSSDAASSFKREFNEIENYTRLVSFSEEGTGLFRKVLNDSTETRIYIPKVFYAEASIFQVFNLSLRAGNRATCLAEPNSILLSEEMTQKIFGKEMKSNEPIIGRIFKSPGIGDVVEEFVVTGIFTNRPTNSHLKFHALVAKKMDNENVQIEQVKNSYSYVTINDPLAASQLVESGVSYPNNESSNRIVLRPISEIHLAYNVSGNPEPGANKQLLFFLVIIAVIILLLASTNHTNNTIFNSIDRAREIGVRKVLGIKPWQLFLTFLGEAFLINVFAILLSVGIFKIGVQVINVQTDIPYPSFNEINIQFYALVILLLLLVSTILSGLYPAFYLTSLSPIASLKSKYELMSSKQFSSAGKVIRSLLIFQLGISICFLSGLYIVYAQLEYLENEGRSPMEIAISGIFPGSSAAGEKFTEEVYFGLDDYQQTSALESYSISNLYKDEIKTIQWIKLDSVEKSIKLSVVDHGYINNAEYSFLSGRNFHHRFGHDAGNAIVTEETMKAAGYNHPDSILSKTLFSERSRWKVIGVVKDKNVEEPTIYLTGFRYRTYLDVVLNYPGGRGETLNQFLDKNEYYLSKALPFFSLFKRNYQNRRESEEYLMNMFLFFSIMTLIIANMGMFGLSSFVAQKRQKEIGIRKVLGAESRHILLVLVLDFLKLISIASFVAIPLILLGSKKWLENYAFRISLEPSMIIIPLLIVLLVAMVVVSEKCFKLAVSSPLSSLKSN